MATIKVKCGTCGRPVTTWRFTVYLRAHKHDGEWCPGGYVTTTSPDTRSICPCVRNPLGHTRREHERLWPLTFDSSAVQR